MRISPYPTSQKPATVTTQKAKFFRISSGIGVAHEGYRMGVRAWVEFIKFQEQRNDYYQHDGARDSS